MSNLIYYSTKQIQDLNEQGIVAKVISYEISEEDMMKLAAMQPLEYTRQAIFMTNNTNIVDMVIDSIEDGRIVQGGVLDNKFVLTQYIVTQGIDKLLHYINV